MFSLNETNKFMVYSTSVDLRKGVEPLCGLVRSLGRKPSDGSVYVYFNRSRTLMKLLHWERGGYVIYYKRMEVGRISRKVFQAHETPEHALANRLFPLYEIQMELVLSSPYQHIDESTIPINDQKHHTRKGYIWGDVDGMLEYGLVFFYDKGSRGEKVLKPKLLKRKAAIQSDGYVVYQQVEQSELYAVVALYCMAHARRKFEAIKDSSPEAQKVLYYIAVLYMLEANLKERKATHDEIRAERQEKAVPILDVLKKVLEKYKTADTPKSVLTQACNYALERWDGLCRYCEEGYYDIDNNVVYHNLNIIPTFHHAAQRIAV